MPVFALVDCNNFYVSCERAFNPGLVDRPVIVLSNNDGCAVARSNEAKALGIGMGQPFFKIRSIVEANRVRVFSSNYPLYADMSNRVMQTLAQFTPAMEIYSIDEAFLDLTGFVFTTLVDYARDVRKKVKKDTGIPVSIGIAPTKTLAKIANRIAKQSSRADGVLDLTPEKYRDLALKMIPIEDVWGIGRRLSPFLKQRGINTALDFKIASTSMIKRKMGINGIRIQKELSGESCYPLEAGPTRRKSVAVSRSFKTPVTTLDELSQAISLYISRGAEKLRYQESFAEALTVYVMTNRFKSESYYYNSKTVMFPTASNNTPELIRKGKRLLRQIFQSGKYYTKAGILFSSLTRAGQVQLDLFDATDRDRSQRLMSTLDKINTRMGSYSVRYAAMGLSGQQQWKGACDHRSQAYTTDWEQLLRVY